MQSVVHGTTQLNTEDSCRCLVVVSKDLVAWFIMVSRGDSQGELDSDEGHFGRSGAHLRLRYLQ